MPEGISGINRRATVKVKKNGEELIKSAMNIQECTIKRLMRKMKRNLFKYLIYIINISSAINTKCKQILINEII